MSLSIQRFAMVSLITLGLVALGVASTTASAQGLKIKPGMWKSTTTVNSNLMGTQTNEASKCFKEDEFDPKNMMEGMPADQCDIQTQVDGTVMTYTMVCNLEGGTLSGQGRVESSGDTSKGEMSLTGDLAGGMKMDMQVTSVAERIGDC